MSANRIAADLTRADVIDTLRSSRTMLQEQFASLPTVPVFIVLCQDIPLRVTDERTVQSTTLARASRYPTVRAARTFAARVRNGNGAHGVVMQLRGAYVEAIARLDALLVEYGERAPSFTMGEQE